jgi:hypothetical protein
LRSSFRLDVNINKNSHIKTTSMPKKQEKQQTINEVLRSLNSQQKETLQKLRQLIKNAVPESAEMVKQGKIVYKLKGKDFVWINYTKDHVDLDFAMGTSLSSDLLRSRGVAEHNRNIRHAQISNFTQEKPELLRLVRDAAALGFDHYTP